MWIYFLSPQFCFYPIVDTESYCTVVFYPNFFLLTVCFWDSSDMNISTVFGIVSIALWGWNQNVFLLPPGEGYLGYFQIWTILNMLWTFAYRYLCERMCLFLWNKYLGVEYLHPVESVYGTWWEIAEVISKGSHHFTFPLAMHKSPSSSSFTSYFANVTLLSFSHSSRYLLVYCYRFYLCFLDG